MKWIVSKDEEKLRLIEFLRKKNLPKRIWHQMKSGRFLSIDNQLLSPGEYLSENQIIDLSEYYLDSKALGEIVLDVVHEADEFLIVNKPSGLLVHSVSRSSNEITLNDLVKNYFQQNNIPCLPHPVSRLDRGTSGLIMYAKKPSVQNFFQTYPLEKKYLAVIHGVYPETYFLITAPIQRAPNSIIEREIGPRGQMAVTHVQVLQANNSLSLVQCTLFTGRTHQIRVHLANLGAPIYGDSLYGQEDLISPAYGLHAWRLSFSDSSNPNYSFSASVAPPNYIQELFPNFHLWQ